jgi:hypothetical protein
MGWILRTTGLKGKPAWTITAVVTRANECGYVDTEIRSGLPKSVTDFGLSKYQFFISVSVHRRTILPYMLQSRLRVLQV